MSHRCNRHHPSCPRGGSSTSSSSSSSTPLLIGCTIVRDQAHLVRHWLIFHLLQGIQHVHFYDHHSRDPKALQHATRNLPADITWWPQANASSGKVCRDNPCIIRHAYAHCANRILQDLGPAAWAAIVDVDEYFFVPAQPGPPKTLAHRLARFNEEGVVAAGAVARVFGTSWHKGACSSFSTIATTHSLRTPVSQSELTEWLARGESCSCAMPPHANSTLSWPWSKQSFVKVGALDMTALARGIGRIGVHEHPLRAGYPGVDSQGCRSTMTAHPTLSQYQAGEDDGRWTRCRARQTTPATSKSLRLHHYGNLSPDCMREKARVNQNPGYMQASRSLSLLWIGNAVRDNGIWRVLRWHNATEALLDLGTDVGQTLSQECERGSTCSPDACQRTCVRDGDTTGEALGAGGGTDGEPPRKKQLGGKGKRAGRGHNASNSYTADHHDGRNTEVHEMQKSLAKLIPQK
mmetsp:Transcript_8346/g.14008  ORF Transcript_8346/g.14008 Transcript_8346/m.14008 type:complete len:463 (+) Transcript_8346:14-1402(+)